MLCTGNVKLKGLKCLTIIGMQSKLLKHLMSSSFFKFFFAVVGYEVMLYKGQLLVLV